MNVFNKVTLQGLKKNKTRTYVTIIGIVLSAAMITAVTTFVSTLQNYMLELNIIANGDWHICYSNTNSDFKETLSQNKDIKKLVISENVGYSFLEGGQNEYKPYLFVRAFSDEMFDTFTLDLIDGRLPLNDKEIVISDHIESNGHVKYKVGDVLNLETGERFLEGEKLFQEIPLCVEENKDAASTQIAVAEELVIKDSKTYTVVGICRRPSFESYSAPGYTVITKLDKASLKPSDSLNIYVSLKSPRKVYEFAENIRDTTSFIYVNGDLLRYQGVSDSDSFNSVLYGLAAILIALIMVGSILLIYNSFSISLSERSRQFGILSSVGATKRQLLRSVIFEGGFVGLIGIPIGIFSGILGIGITLLFIGDIFKSMSTAGLGISLHVSLESIAAAVLVGIFTILLSAYIPARKATKVSAIDAIRQTSDIKINAKKMKTSKLTQKLFGLPGILALKNFRRNKKQYRSTVISLFISIVLFISASSFGMFLTKGIRNSASVSNFDISYYNPSLSDSENQALFSKLAAVKGVKNSGWYGSFYANTDIKTSLLSEKYINYLKNMQREIDPASHPLSLNILFVDDTNYKKYAEALGVNLSEYTDKENLKVIAVSNFKEYNKKTQRYESVDIFKSLSPLQITVNTVNEQGDVAAGKPIAIGVFTDAIPYGAFSNDGSGMKLILPYYLKEAFAKEYNITDKMTMESVFSSDNPTETAAEMTQIIKDAGYDQWYLYNAAEVEESNRNVILILNVFSYGFIILISLITIANVFNTISTNIRLRRREFAMLKSIGMTDRDFNKMMNFECAFYGIKALLYGLPSAFAITYLIYKSVLNGVDIPFALPYTSVAISVFSVFFVVFVTMIYSTGKVKKENTIEALKNDNL